MLDSRLFHGSERARDRERDTSRRSVSTSGHACMVRTRRKPTKRCTVDLIADSRTSVVATKQQRTTTRTIVPSRSNNREQYLLYFFFFEGFFQGLVFLFFFESVAFLLREKAQKRAKFEHHHTYTYVFIISCLRTLGINHKCGRMNT